MIIRAKTDNLIATRPLTQKRADNTAINKQEMQSGATILTSKPQRLVFELTNACNLNCAMCGRNAGDFVPTIFKLDWFNKFEPVMDLVEEVTLMGWGEPTIHPDFVEMLKFLDKKGLRKYFCTNGMRLAELENAIFDYNVDVFAISLDGMDKETNERIRRGLDFDKVMDSLRSIVRRRNSAGSRLPHMNFVFTAMRSNIEQLPGVVELAANVGLDEVKAVFLTAFEPSMMDESLYNEMNLVKRVFEKTQETAEKHNILLKLPHLRGEDPAGDKLHKDCFTAWRDFFLGSDGYVRSCMSSPDKLFHIDQYADFDLMWNSTEYQDWRLRVNDSDKMNDSCKRCYQSSFANWNQQHAFVQIGNKFSPDWEKGGK